MELTFIFILGAILGSFLNVVIYRLPRQESIIAPGSHCPYCSHKLRPWENIPILSYLLLRGKCSRCKHPIGLRYLLIEVITPVLLISLYLYSGLSWDFFKNSVLVLLLIPATFIDLDHRLILNKITLPGMFLGLGLSIAGDPAHFLQPLLGLLAGGGSLWLIALLGQLIYKQESMGGGDIKFGAMIGAFMTPQSVGISLFLAFFIAAIFVLLGMLLGKIKQRSTIPFGPFIALGAFAAINFQSQLIHFYLNWVLH
ncbi:MAG: prepilin peptidase [Calditrichaeota bacterium]|nr:MAG: prepilin peptidase [Calditrichota bacterium]